jgi:hypothetical protein
MQNKTRTFRTAASAVVAIAVVMVTIAAARANRSSDSPWDARASAELTQTLHRMHDVWNAGNPQALKSIIVGDDQLVTFELDPATHVPIRLASKRDLDGFVDRIVSDAATSKAVYRLEHPVIQCKATASVGVCTEECTVHTTTPDGVERVDKLWSTTTAVKQNGEWKWIQWQMSTAAAPRIFKNGVPIAGQP